MRAAVLSDIHVEFHRDNGKSFIQSLDPTGVDVLILAGDVANASTIRQALEGLCARFEKAQVLYVVGNHELYGGSPDKVYADICRAAAKCPNLRFLDHKMVEVGGVRFAGSTLWFRDDPLNAIYQNSLNDFYQIKGFVPWVYDENRKAEGFLRAVMASRTPPDVIVTHHLPSQRCVVPQYRGSPLNRFFVAPVADGGMPLPKLWVYGHTHTPFDEVHDGCRFLCNAFGYPHEPKRQFRESLTIEMEPA